MAVKVCGGIRGLRLNFETLGVTDPQVAVDQFRLASTQAAEQGWHVQVNTRPSIVEALEDHILSGPVTGRLRPLRAGAGPAN